MTENEEQYRLKSVKENYKKNYHHQTQIVISLYNENWLLTFDVEHVVEDDEKVKELTLDWIEPPNEWHDKRQKKLNDIQDTVVVMVAAKLELTIDPYNYERVNLGDINIDKTVSRLPATK